MYHVGRNRVVGICDSHLGPCATIQLAKEKSFCNMQETLDVVSKEFAFQGHAFKGPCAAARKAGNSGKRPGNVSRDIQRQFQKLLFDDVFWLLRLGFVGLIGGMVAKCCLVCHPLVSNWPTLPAIRFLATWLTSLCTKKAVKLGLKAGRVGQKHMCQKHESTKNDGFLLGNFHWCCHTNFCPGWFETMHGAMWTVRSWLSTGITSHMDDYVQRSENL